MGGTSEALLVAGMRVAQGHKGGTPEHPVVLLALRCLCPQVHDTVEQALCDDGNAGGSGVVAGGEKAIEIAGGGMMEAELGWRHDGGRVRVEA